ncbi:hypothetical protein JCM5350_006467 [Sporobolomyces pararoseus]
MARTSETSRMAPVPPITIEPSCPPSPPSVIPVSAPPPSPLATFAAEMFVWLWFAPSSANEEDSGDKEAEMRMQFAPSSRFVSFCHEVLTTTQVSHSVVILALLFVSRLKQKNAIKGSPGSEYRLAVVGLMLANKVLDDNTYTARTWSQVSSLELKPLVEGEAEFLKGLNWSLHVTEKEFRSFLKLLEGHVAARNARTNRAPRKIASTSRVRRELEKSTGVGGGPLGLGITTPSQQSFISSTVPQSVEGDRNVRRRIVGRDGGGGTTMSASTTPTLGFGSFSHPLSAPHPHPQPQAYLQQSQQPVSAEPIYQASTSRPNPSPFEISPTSNRQSGSRKRHIDESSSKPFSFPSLPHLLLPQNPPPMSRSQSSSAAFSSSTPAYTPTSASSQPHSSPSPLPTPTHGNHGPFPRPPQLERVEQIHHQFDTLADRFSPRYNPGQPPHQRLSSLDYYSLAAGQGQGRLHQMPPPLPPSNLSFYGVPPHGQYTMQHQAPPPTSSIGRSGGRSLASSPCLSSRQTNFAPSKPSVLSGLRSSPPHDTAVSSSRRSSQQHQQQPAHPFSHHLPPLDVSASSSTSRRPSKISSSPGIQSFDDGTSTPRPSTGGSMTGGGLPVDLTNQLMNRLPPLSAGIHPHPHSQWPQLPPPPHFFSANLPIAHWSAYANAGPPGVYWAAYPPSTQ